VVTLDSDVDFYRSSWGKCSLCRCSNSGSCYMYKSR